MISNRIRNSLIKYFLNQASSSELEELDTWVKDDSNKKEFFQYVKINYIIDYNLKKFEINNSQNKLKKFIKRQKKINKVKIYMKFAAVIVLFLSIGYFLQQNFFSITSVSTIPTKNITLELNAGKTKILNENDAIEVIDEEGNVIGAQIGNELIYKNNSKVNKLVYNTLAIPYGKRFTVILSDGTKIKLNAGTILRYPVQFAKGKCRQVFLEGEAFFDVVKDKSHPFIVNANEINVCVLGTKFNLSSYLEDKTINTVLVEGSVKVYPKGINFDNEKATLLKPSYKATWDKNKKIITTEKVDSSIYTAWINNKIIFKHVQFSEIIKKLERNYNVEIINNNKSLNDEFITASFDIETIDQVFKAINEIHPIDYSIQKNKIVIMSK